jgi:WD40 repeat protein
MTTTESGPYSSMAALWAANTHLAELRRSGGAEPELWAAVGAFLERGSATGALLAEADARRSAQSLLDYWASALERASLPAPEASLAEFDPLLAPEIPDEDCPYLGLDAFDEANAAVFFGRRRVVAELVERLRDQRLLAVVGPSGSGKSSLVRAGLLPALRAGGVPGSAGWQILPPMVPGPDPGAALDRALNAAGRSGAPLLLLIDQFEETFTLCTDEARRGDFLARVVALATGAGASRVVLTMRSDFEPFIARAEALQPLYEAGKLALPPLTAGELREAIERPAEQVGLKFEPGLIDALLGDILGEPAALPLLQYSLLRLWEERERNRVTLAAYQRVGGGRLALARGADAAYVALIPEEQLTARRILLRLVRPGEGLEITSNRVRRADLDRGGEDPGRVARVLAKLLDAHLLRLTPGDTPADAQVELAHEALVRNWPTLVEWLEDERVALRQRQRLSAAAEQWQRLGRDPAALLAGRLLEEARQYEDLSELEREFVQAGVAAEAAHARRDTRTNTLIRALLVITTITSVIAIYLATQAFQARAQADRNAAQALTIAGIAQTSQASSDLSRATAVTAQARAEADQRSADAQRELAQAAQAQTERQRKVVDSQRLAFAAQNQFRSNLETGLLLAYEANVSDDNAVTRQALHDAIDAVSWRPLPLAGHTGILYSAVFSPDGSRILTASGDTTARLWDAQGQPLATLSGHTGTLYSAVFSPDGSRILTASNDNTARLWNAEGQPLATLSGHTDAVRSAVFSPDGTRILTASDDKTARLWDVSAALNAGANAQPLATLAGHTSYVYSAVFSPDGSRILTASADNTARLWDVSAVLNAGAAAQPLAILTGHTGAVNSAAFSPDGASIITVSNDNTARLWDAKGQPLATLIGHGGPVYRATFSPNGRNILTTSFDSTARLWSSDGQPRAVLKGHTGIVWSAAFSPDGQLILTTSDDKTARLWNVSAALNAGANAQPVATLTGHTDAVKDAVFSPDGSRILTASLDKTARLWDATSQPLATIAGHKFRVWSALFSPDGSRILTASDDQTARLWDTAGQPIATLTGHTGAVRNAVFSPDGTRILTASEDRTARLWDAQGQFIVSFRGHTGAVYSAVFSPDGSRILTASDDGTARLWSATGQALATLTGHTSYVYSAVFSPDGSRILTASVDGTARQYLVLSADLRKAAACRVGRGLSEDEIARFQVPTPLAFDYARRQCPPVYSWER